jgi:hypothetical protein
MTIDPRRAYIIQFRRSLKVWQKTLLPDVVCVQQARLIAKRLHPLTEAEQKDVDKFLLKELGLRTPGRAWGLVSLFTLILKLSRADQGKWLSKTV